MLAEIYCDKFFQKRIIFADGLNVVLGSSEATNSTGKSTLLLIVDYCFGGDSYCNNKDSDIIANIGNHIIFFKFVFNNCSFWFARDTARPKTVFSSNERKELVSEMPLKEFTSLLNGYYLPENDSMSFRTIVGRFLRVSGKENIHLDKPLKGFNGDKDSQGINALEELFGFFKDLKDLKEKVKILKDEKKTRDDAVKFSIISSKISNKKEYDAVLAHRNKLIEEKDKILEQGNIRHFDGDALFSEETINLKTKLETLLKSQSRLKYRKNKLSKLLNNNSQEVRESDFRELQLYSPSINIRKLEEINNFHKEIINIVTSEINEEANRVDKEIDDLNKQIIPVEEKLRRMNIPSFISPDVMKAVSAKEAEIIADSTSIDNYEKKLALKNFMAENIDALSRLESSVAENISQALNAEMEKISDDVDKPKRYSPVFEIKSSEKYNFESPNDTGTGSNSKNLIVFDIALLKISNLPILIHDSLIFKNIGDAPFCRIVKQYSKFSKQIFIAIDKIESYHDAETERILRSKAVVKLKDGEELFGKNWGKKRNALIE